MSSFDWGAFAVTIQQAATDLQANAPLPVPAPMSMEDAAAKLKSAEPTLAALDAWVKAHPGAIQALLTILGGLQAQGVGWAADLSAILSAAPGGLATAEEWLPSVISAMTMFAPAPTWQPGPDPFRR